IEANKTELVTKTQAREVLEQETAEKTLIDIRQYFSTPNAPGETERQADIRKTLYTERLLDRLNLTELEIAFTQLIITYDDAWIRLKGIFLEYLAKRYLLLLDRVYRKPANPINSLGFINGMGFSSLKRQFKASDNVYN